MDDGRVNHGQRAESGQSSELWRAGQSRDVTLSRHWWDVTRNWLQAVLPGPGASQLGPDCYVMTLARGNTGHGDTGSLLNFMVELKPSKN